MILLVSTLLFASVSLAQPPGGAGGAGAMPDNATIFENNDGNGDGEITRAEADAAGLPLSENWDMFDTNSDGKVVAAELDAVRGGSGGGGAGGPGAGAAAAAPQAADEDEDEEDEEEDEE
jgi:hypothetical protein